MRLFSRKPVTPVTPTVAPAPAATRAPSLPAPSTDVLASHAPPAAADGKPHVHFALPLPRSPQAKPSLRPTTPVSQRLLSFFNARQMAAQMLVSELVLRFGLDLDSIDKNTGEVESTLAEVPLEDTVRRVLAEQGSDKDLQAVAAFFEDKKHEALAEKLANLTPMLRNMAQMPPVPQTDVAQERPSKTSLALLELLIPDLLPLPDGAPVNLLVHALKDSLSRSERKAAVAWMSDPTYALAARLQGAVELAVHTAAVRDDLLETLLKKLAPHQLAACDEILKATPDDVLTQRLRARMRALSGDIPGAIADYDAVMQRDVDPSDYFARAAMYLHEGKTNEALVDAERAVALDLSNGAYYGAYLRASADALTRTLEATHDPADKVELLGQRGVCLLALNDEPGARRDFDAAMALQPEHPLLKALGAALAGPGIALPQALPEVTRGAVDEAKMADTIRRVMPWMDAVLGRTVATLKHDFGFTHVEDDMLAVRRALGPLEQPAKAAVQEFVARALSAEQQRDIASLLGGEQGTFIRRKLLPLVDKLQLRQDLWADTLRTDVPLAVAIPRPTLPPELRELVQVLLPSAMAAMGGLHAAVVDKFAEDLARDHAADLPQLLALCQVDGVRLLVMVYKQAVSQVYAGAGGGAVVDVARALAPGQIQRANAILQASPNDADALRARAIALSLMGEHPQSLADFAQLLQQEPTARNYVQRAMEYMLVGQHDHALGDVNQALKLAPLCSDALTVRASVHFAREAKTEAAQDAEQAMALALTEAQQQSAAALYAVSVQGEQGHDDEATSSDEGEAA